MKKLFKIILAVVVSVVFCGAAVSLFRPAKKDDTPTVDKPVVNKPVVSATVNECAIVDQVVDDMGMKVTTDNTRAGKPWLLSTEITKEGVATDSAITWSSSWGVTTGSWGTETQGEVSDYVEITPLENGQAEVEFLKPFGTTIEVKAAVDSSTYVTVIFGYLEAEKVNFALISGDIATNPEYFFLNDGVNKMDIANDLMHNRETYYFTFVIDMDIYCFNMAYVNSKMHLRLSEDHYAFLKEVGGDLSDYDSAVSSSQGYMSFGLGDEIVLYAYFIQPFVYHDTEIGDTFYIDKINDYIQLAEDNPDIPAFELRFEVDSIVKEYAVTIETKTLKLFMKELQGA